MLEHLRERVHKTRLFRYAPPLPIKLLLLIVTQLPLQFLHLGSHSTTTDLIHFDKSRLSRHKFRDGVAGSTCRFPWRVQAYGF